MDKKLIVANWKNHPDSLAQAQEILDFINDYLESLNDPPSARSGGGGKEFGLVVCPPFIFIEEVGKILKTSHLEHDAVLGAQDIAIEDKISLTGEVSGTMLNKLGVRYVIIGHSERRWKLGESDKMVNQKIKITLRDDMIPIVCIGEKTRDSDFRNFLEEQIRTTFAGLSVDEIGKCIVAYEPVWAISTNTGAHPDTPTSTLGSIGIIKGLISPRAVLYGGSLNSKNIMDFLKENEIDGVLVGGASVDKEEFVKILKAVFKLK